MTESGGVKERGEGEVKVRVEGKSEGESGGVKEGGEGEWVACERVEGWMG